MPQILIGEPAGFEIPSSVGPILTGKKAKFVIYDKGRVNGKTSFLYLPWAKLGSRASNYIFRRGERESEELRNSNLYLQDKLEALARSGSLSPYAR